MALFVDSTSPSVQDLLRYDRNLLEVANAEGLECGEKLALARQQVCSEITAFLRRERPGTTIDRVVATEPLRRWTAEVALSLFYRDAHYSQLNERYRGKWKEYDALAKETRRFVLESGLGCVGAPIRKAQRPIVTTTSGLLPAGSYFLRMAWAGARQAVGEASDVTVATLSGPGGLLVSPASAPEGVSGWHVYAGVVEEQIQRQSVSPLPVPGNWQIDAALSSGEAPSEGQEPEYFVTASNVLPRG
jgi:hypothetical protein